MAATPQDPTAMTTPALALLEGLARAAGRSHDLGKAGSFFVDKLQRAAQGHSTESESARHEWISLKTLEAMLQGASLHEALSGLTGEALMQVPPLRQGTQGAWEALQYVCASHHRLFGPTGASRAASLGKLDTSNHVFGTLAPLTYPLDDSHAFSTPFADTLAQDLQAFCRAAAEMAGEDAGKNEPFWYGLAWQARVALILADHGVSARLAGQKDKNTGEPGAIPADTPGLYANTWPRSATPAGKGFNQPLEFHLNAVAETAGEVVRAMWQLALPALDAAQVHAILAAAPQNLARQFGWQDRAVETIRQHRQTTGAPLLVFNVASTGAGKTFMNVKAACAAATDAPRLSYALNLRTLTLQTGDALTRDLKLGPDSVATVIGDQVTAQLHESERSAADPQSSTGADAFENIEFRAVGGREGLPDWLSPITEKRPEWRNILATPVLVSTVDFLVNAGEPGRQGHHAAAYLRLMHSDLILDEVDSYDVESLVAILRLVHVAASLGRNVVCSSATLPWPIADAIARAYQSGHDVWSSLRRQSPQSRSLVITDSLAPRWMSPGAPFRNDYQGFLKALMAQQVPATKRVALQGVERRKGCKGLLAAIEQGSNQLHNAHRWTWRKTDTGDGAGKTVSFGLVRVANIRTANRVAKHLEQQPDTVVCLYHARDFTIQRHLKERSLDRLLNRKQGNTAIDEDDTIEDLRNRAGTDSLRFVVVATPVEEIGRDHDFDWAVIEPSGSHSIVQTAGRVNRHRRLEVTEPNILILQYNARALAGQEVVFTRPGPEGSRTFAQLAGVSDAYPDLEQMLDWGGLDQLTAALAFDELHPLVQGEQHVQQKLLLEPLKVLCRERKYESLWMTDRFYGKYPLRGGDDHHLQDWRVIPDETGRRVWQQRVLNGITFTYQDKPAPETDMLETSWLSWSIETLWAACQESGITPEEGMKIRISGIE